MAVYQWGILSTANIGRKAMIPALQKSEMAQVAAVASRNADRARLFADELDIPRSFGSYQALLDDDGIDAVYIPLPNHLHKEWTIRAANAGKHILCEKPLALNAEECREMKAAAEANGVQLMESFMYRHHPRIMAAQEMVRSGLIGDIRTIESAFTFKLTNKEDIRYQPEMGGGALMDVGCYCVNLSRLMAGREPVSVQARAVWAPSGVDDQLAGILDFGEGLMAHFDCGFNQTRRQRAFIAGSQGYLDLPDVFIPGLSGCDIHEHKAVGAPRIHAYEGVDQYRLIADDFMRAIDGHPLPFPPEDAVYNMRTIQALLDSAQQNGQPVDL